MGFLRRSLVGLFLLSVTIALLFWAGTIIVSSVQDRLARDGSGRPASERIFSANVIAIEPRSVAPVLSTFGEVRSRRTLEIRAPAGGTVVELSPVFEEGGTVAAGDLLVAIDPREAQAALDVARTDLSEAEAGLREAERALDLAADELVSAEAQLALRDRALVRARDLADRGVGTAANVESAELAEAQAAQAVLVRRQALAQAEAQLDQSRTALARRQIQLSEAERDLAETRITAEFAGTLADVSVVEGGLVTVNERLADLIDPDALEVSFRLSTSQHARLLGPDGRLLPATIEVVLDVFGADLTATGAITRESGAVGEGQTGRLLFATLENPAGFRPGDFVTVRIIEPELDAVAVIPAAALDGSGTVLALGDEDRLEALPVTVLRRQGNDVIVATEGMAGREVVAERSPVLGAGIRVRPLRPQQQAASEARTAPAEEMIELTPERRAALVAFVERMSDMPMEAKERVLIQLRDDRVPAQVVARIEARMGG